MRASWRDWKVTENCRAFLLNQVTTLAQFYDLKHRIWEYTKARAFLWGLPVFSRLHAPLPAGSLAQALEPPRRSGEEDGWEGTEEPGGKACTRSGGRNQEGRLVPVLQLSVEWLQRTEGAFCSYHSRNWIFGSSEGDFYSTIFGKERYDIYFYLGISVKISCVIPSLSSSVLCFWILNLVASLLE